MCGIVGVLNFDKNNSIDSSTLVKMRDSMIHRGPDDSGILLDRNVGLAFRRLSIIDLEGGNQPISNEDHSIHSVFNGEIYNYHSLTSYLKKENHIFKTKSDSETIVHLYEQKGIDFLQELNGMFAIAVWDSKKRKLLLARDRLGIKPLYYYKNKDFIIFSSEIKAILKHPKVIPIENTDALKEFFTFRYISGEQTLFKDIYRLLPGHYALCRDNEFTIKKYWDAPKNVEHKNLSLKKVEEETLSLIEDSIKYRLISDVPLGTYCSGGIDSSLVTAIATKFSSKSFNTFCIKFSDENWDESQYSQLIASQYKTTHHNIPIEEHHFYKNLKKLTWYFDEPVSHPNSIPIYFLSQYARQFVTVTLTGEGADEMFSGYPRHIIINFLDKIKFVPAQCYPVLHKILNFSNNHKINKLSYSLSLSNQNSVIFNSCFTEHKIIDKLLNINQSSDWLAYRKLCYKNAGENKSLLERLQYLELKTYLVSALDRLDRMSMAVGMESRVPFLDHRLVEFISKLPTNLKLRRLNNKYLLKKVAHKYLPSKIINRPKSGFGVPLNLWINNLGGFGSLVNDIIHDNLKNVPYLNSSEVYRLLREHRAGQSNNSEIIWLIVSFLIWRHVFIEGMYNE
jgi:asparagine synthase (glutamine-hydrolysing)